MTRAAPTTSTTASGSCAPTALPSPAFAAFERMVDSSELVVQPSTRHRIEIPGGGERRATRLTGWSKHSTSIRRCWPTTTRGESRPDSRPTGSSSFAPRSCSRRLLPPAPARVLDVGGGAGVHALPLIRSGYEVVLVDPVVLHVEQARAAGVTDVRLGDAGPVGFRRRIVRRGAPLGPPPPLDRDYCVCCVAGIGSSGADRWTRSRRGDLAVCVGL